MSNSKRWEDRLGSLVGAEYVKNQDYLQEMLSELIDTMIIDEEYKVRQQLSSLLKLVVTN